MRTSRQPILKRTGAVALTFFCLFVASGRSAVAQSQDEKQKQTPEVQQLRERLQQLEQTVQELKGQIDALEEAKKPPTAEIKRPTSTPTAPAHKTAEAKPQNDQTKGESSFTVYGFAMLDAGYQFKQADPNWFDVVRPVKLPSVKD